MKKVNFCNGWFLRKQEETQSKPVRLPHDAMIHEPRNKNNPSGPAGAYFPGGRYVYEKKFSIPEQADCRNWLLEFEGAYRDTEVWLNGEKISENHSGYRGFYVSSGAFLNSGMENTLQVVVRNDQHPNSRWYTGSGLYRPVWLYTSESLAIPPQSILIDTPQVERAISKVKLRCRIHHAYTEISVVDLRVSVSDPNGCTVYSQIYPTTLFPGENPTITRQFYLKDVQLWSPESPNLYICHIEIVRNGTVLEYAKAVFGIRQIQLDPVNGLRINGNQVLLRGGCLHHDNGILGSACFADAEQRRVALCKEAGLNALRIAHQPMSKAMLDACDSMGILVWEESFDVWRKQKVVFDDSCRFTAEWESDLLAMVEKDYNHPCVIAYSIGNEIEELAQPEGVRISRQLTDRIRSLDPTRLIANAINGQQSVIGTRGISFLKDTGILTEDHILELTGNKDAGDTQIVAAFMSRLANGNVNDMMTMLTGKLNRIIEHPAVGAQLEEIMSHLDLCGYNYMMRRYEMDLNHYPDRVIVGSETNPPNIDQLWNLVEMLPACIGDFTWSCWDYIGEPGVGLTNYEGKKGFQAPWPVWLAYCGDMDLTGYRRPMSYFREIVYGLRKQPYLSVEDPQHFGKKAVCTPWAVPETIESWSWPGSEGLPVRVVAYSDADEVALFLNGREIGRAPAGKAQQFQAQFITEYEYGELMIVAYENGCERGRFTLHSAQPNYMLGVQLSSNKLDAEGEQLSFLSITLQDSEGITHTAHDCEVEIILGEGLELAGFGSADPISTEGVSSHIHTLFRGRALAAVRGCISGQWPVEIKCKDCQPIHLSLNVG